MSAKTQPRLPSEIATKKTTMQTITQSPQSQKTNTSLRKSRVGDSCY